MSEPLTEPLIEFPPPDEADDPLSAPPSPSGASEAPDAAVGSPEWQIVSEGPTEPPEFEFYEGGTVEVELLRVRATVNLRGLPRGREAMVDPRLPWIAAALRRRALVPSD